MLHSLDQENLRPAETVLIFNWKSILDKFTESFQQTFSTSKKVCLRHCRTVFDTSLTWCTEQLFRHTLIVFLPNSKLLMVHVENGAIWFSWMLSFSFFQTTRFDSHLDEHSTNRRSYLMQSCLNWILNTIKKHCIY